MISKEEIDNCTSVRLGVGSLSIELNVISLQLKDKVLTLSFSELLITDLQDLFVTLCHSLKDIWITLLLEEGEYIYSGDYLKGTLSLSGSSVLSFLLTDDISERFNLEV